MFGGARVTNLVVFFLCYRSSNSLRLVYVQTCSKFGRKQPYLFRPTLFTGRPVLWLVLRFRSFVLVKALTLTMKTHCLQHKDLVIDWCGACIGRTCV